MLLHPLNEYVPSSLAAGGRAILGLLDEVSLAEALDLACHARVGVLLAAHPRFEGSTKDQTCYDTFCQHVEQWVMVYLPQFQVGFRTHQGCSGGGPCGYRSRQRIIQTAPLADCNA